MPTEFPTTTLNVVFETAPTVQSGVSRTPFTLPPTLPRGETIYNIDPFEGDENQCLNSIENLLITSCKEKIQNPTCSKKENPPSRVLKTFLYLKKGRSNLKHKKLLPMWIKKTIVFQTLLSSWEKPTPLVVKCEYQIDQSKIQGGQLKCDEVVTACGANHVIATVLPDKIQICDDIFENDCDIKTSTCIVSVTKQN